jgi:hypothetical protein
LAAAIALRRLTTSVIAVTFSIRQPGSYWHRVIKPKETVMMLDDVYGSDPHDVLLKQEQAWRDRTPPELEWDESEASLVVADVLGAWHGSHEHD